MSTFANKWSIYLKNFSFVIFSMWTKWELSELEGTIRDITLEDVLTEKEIEVIKENSTRYSNLKSGIFVPKHKDKVNKDQFFLSLIQALPLG